MPRRTTDQEPLARWLGDHGRIITTQEAAALGIGKRSLDHLVASGRLLRIRRGVLAAPGMGGSPDLALRGALAAAGPGAVASHLSAAALWDLIPGVPARPEIALLRPRRPRLDGVVVHGTDVAIETMTWKGLHVTTASRTLLDLASRATFGDGRLHAVIDEALQRHLTAVPKLGAMLRDWPVARCPGRARLQAALETAGYLGAPEASVLERRMWRLLKELSDTVGLPMPVMEHRVEGGRYRLDFAWPDVLVAVEVDGYAWHWSEESKRRDERRRAVLVSRGWRIAVCCWKDLVDDPQAVAKLIVDTYRLAVADVAG